MSRILIGVDVCKDFLDGSCPTRRCPETLSTTRRPASNNSWPGLDPSCPSALSSSRQALTRKAAVGALLAADLPAVVVNARQVRDFAKGTGQLAKTDVIDAGILAHFGEVVANRRAFLATAGNPGISRPLRPSRPTRPHARFREKTTATPPKGLRKSPEEHRQAHRLSPSDRSGKSKTGAETAVVPPDRNRLLA